MENGIKDSKCPGSCPGSPKEKSLSWVPQTKIAVLGPQRIKRCPGSPVLESLLLFNVGHTEAKLCC